MPLVQRSSDVPVADLAIVAAVFAGAGQHMASTLDALSAQSLGPRDVLVVGGSEPSRRLAEERHVSWVPTLEEGMAELGADATHVWLLHGDARPRPDALEALAREAVRVEAGVSGSKILRDDESRHLESVGAATDVFAGPYTGLEVDEVDQEQYDVVRDVAFVSGVSMLVRRDLLRGLGGPDKLMAPQAASIDLCQRARLAGGRVVVVPSSEVIHVEGHAEPVWREEAGRLRAVLKAYSWLTLPWVVPAGFAVGLLAASLRTVSGRPLALWDFARAWVWNMVHLPSLIGARRAVYRSRIVADDELFRYQVRGSTELATASRSLSDRWRRRVQKEAAEISPESFDASQTWSQQPIILAVIAGAVFVVGASWSLLFSGMPAAGFTLPLPDSGLDTLSSYAGGWNPGGLGSAHPLHPSLAPISLAQIPFFGNNGVAAVAITMAAVAAGLIGTTRLLRRAGVGTFARYVAGAALVGGPAALAMADGAYWPGMLAVAATPWAVSSFLGPWPRKWIGRLSSVATSVLMIGLVGALAPAAIILPLLVMFFWALLGPGSWWGVLRAASATTLALPLLFPWLAAVSLGDIARAGTLPFWDPPVVLPVAAGVAVVGGLFLGDRSTAGLAAVGGTLAAGGAVLARSTELGVGRELIVAGLIAAALGVALLTAAALDLPRHLEAVGLIPKATAYLSVVAGLVLVASSLLLISNGRAGLPEDQFGDQLGFAGNRAADHGPDRILLVGPEGTLLGDTRQGDGYVYRVVSAPTPPLTEAWLADPMAGDQTLERTLERLLESQVVRPGEELAPFGIRWVVITGPTRFDAAITSQLDLKPLSFLEYEVYENENPSPRAVSQAGTPWRFDGVGYSGRPTDRVYMAENADSRWGENWLQVDWANEVSGRSGMISFLGVPLFQQLGWLAGGWALLLLLASVGGRIGGRP